jgi:hypothetical protein
MGCASSVCKVWRLHFSLTPAGFVGVSLLMFGATVFVLCRGRSLREIHLLNVIISVLFLFLSTLVS